MTMTQEQVVRTYSGRTREAAEHAYRADAARALAGGYTPFSHRWTQDARGLTLMVAFRPLTIEWEPPVPVVEAAAEAVTDVEPPADVEATAEVETAPEAEATAEVEVMADAEVEATADFETMAEVEATAAGDDQANGHVESMAAEMATATDEYTAVAETITSEALADEELPSSEDSLAAEDSIAETEPVAELESAAEVEVMGEADANAEASTLADGYVESVEPELAMSADDSLVAEATTMGESLVDEELSNTENSLATEDSVAPSDLAELASELVAETEPTVEFEPTAEVEMMAEGAATAEVEAQADGYVEPVEPEPAKVSRRQRRRRRKAAAESLVDEQLPSSEASMAAEDSMTESGSTELATELLADTEPAAELETAAEVEVTAAVDATAEVDAQSDGFVESVESEPSMAANDSLVAEELSTSEASMWADDSMAEPESVELASELTAETEPVASEPELDMSAAESDMTMSVDSLLGEYEMVGNGVVATTDDELAEPEPEAEAQPIEWPAEQIAAVEEAPALPAGRSARLTVQVLDLHCAGEPLRMIRAGFPDVPDMPVLERRRWVAENADEIRRAVILEPRGHSDMYGAILLPPHSPEADICLLFMHNEGYSTMCGHGVIAVTTALIEEGLFPATAPTTRIRYEVPAGIVTAEAVTTELEDGSFAVGEVSFTNVPSYLAGRSIAIAPDGIELHGQAAEDGHLTVDLAFGGAYYGVVDAASLGLRVVPEQASALRRAGAAITDVLRREHTPAHPTDPDLGFVYGTIIVDRDAETSPDGRARGAHWRNVTIFADAELDRSPCGSGTSALLAHLYYRGHIELGEEFINAGITGESFVGRVEAETQLGEEPAVLTSVSGRAFVTGYSTLIVDERDPLGEGFLLR